MFEVIFEVCPRSENWELYLSTAGALRPLLESQKGFVENVRYKSLTRPGWVLSLSDWDNEKALIRWRTQMKHHHAQEAGRNEILGDYHLRVGQVTSDTNLQSSSGVRNSTNQERFDETEVGEAKTVSLINATFKTPEGHARTSANEVVEALGIHTKSCRGLVAWDVFEAILTPGDMLILCSWINEKTATESLQEVSDEQRIRQVRIIRDYGMFDRREAPQYYPDVSEKRTD
jgi:heme-degrading monooxygenase HmoA